MNDNETKVKITGIDIPFWDLVVLIIKISLASIPAFFIIWFVFMLFSMLFGGMFSVFMHPGGF